MLFELFRVVGPACAGFSALMLVMTVAAWIDGRMAVSVVRAEAKKLTSEPVTSDVISAFKCSGCKGLFLREQPGHLRIGDGFEFCSKDCHESPLPFPGFEESEIRLVS